MNVIQKLYVLLTVAVAITYAYSGDNHFQLNDVDPDPDLEEYLRGALENFRDQMKKGIPDIHMPILDPLKLRNLDIDVNENMASLFLRIKEVSVSSLSRFNVTHLHPNLEHLYLAINLTLPELFVQGHYITDGKLLKIFPIYGSGHFWINATNIDISGKGKLNFVNNTLGMNMLKLDLLWENIAVDLENFLGGGDFAEVLQRVVPAIGKDVFIACKPLILQKLEEALTQKVNEKLDDPLVKELIKGIHPDY